VLWYAGKKHSKAYVPSYFGSGVILHSAIKKYGTSTCKNRVVLWARDLDELNSLERKTIDRLRSKYGRKCLNRSEGGDGLTSEQLKVLWKSPALRTKHREALLQKYKDPEYKQRQIAAVKTALSKPGVYEARAATLRKTFSRPEVRERFSIIAKETNSRPEVKSRISEMTNKAYEDPEVRRRHKEAIYNVRYLSGPFRTIWESVKSQFPEVKPPHHNAHFSKWEAFVSSLRVEN
jgi:hypothetical protein